MTWIGWEALLKGWQWPGGPPEGPAVVGRPFWRARRGQEALPEGLKGLGGLPEGAGRGLEALPEGWVGSGGPPKGLGGVGRLSWRSEMGRESPKEGWEEWEALQEGWEGSGGSPGEREGSGGVGRLSRMAGRRG